MGIIDGPTLPWPKIRLPRSVPPDSRCCEAAELRRVTGPEYGRGVRHNGPPSNWLTVGYLNLSLTRVKFGWREFAMKWKTPVIIEIAVGLEINAYACAEV
jgi:coenzyme PQQ precursor peptide PqqA